MDLNVVNTITGVVCALGTILTLCGYIAKKIRNACGNKRSR
jgi:hypothetical protein